MLRLDGQGRENKTEEERFTGERREIQLQAALYGLEGVCDFLSDENRGYIADIDIDTRWVYSFLVQPRKNRGSRRDIRPGTCPHFGGGLPGLISSSVLVIPHTKVDETTDPLGPP